MDHCKICGKPLTFDTFKNGKPFNTDYDAAEDDYCNEKCRDKHIRKEAKRDNRKRKKYGAGGYVYDSYKTGDIFKNKRREGYGKKTGARGV